MSNLSYKHTIDFCSSHRLFTGISKQPFLFYLFIFFCKLQSWTNAHTKVSVFHEALCKIHIPVIWSNKCYWKISVITVLTFI